MDPLQGAIVGASLGGAAGFVICRKSASASADEAGGSLEKKSKSDVSISSVPAPVQAEIDKMVRLCKRCDKELVANLQRDADRLCACLQRVKQRNPDDTAADLAARAMAFRKAASSSLQELHQAARSGASARSLLDSLSAQAAAVESVFQRVVGDVCASASKLLYPTA